MQASKQRTEYRPPVSALPLYLLAVVAGILLALAYVWAH
jgi:hypothetical protein